MYQIKVSDLKTYCEIYFGDLMSFKDDLKKSLSANTKQSVNVIVKPDDLALGVERLKSHKSVDNYRIALDKITAREILLAIKHISPHVLFHESPLSYIGENQAKRFY